MFSDIVVTDAFVEYVWIDGCNKVRSKNRHLTLKYRRGNSEDEVKQNILYQIPSWNYDGSSTNQATTEHSEVILKPVRLYKNPFTTKYNNYNIMHLLVLCETYKTSVEPHETNKRCIAQTIFENAVFKPDEYWFGLEQEFFLIDVHANKPLGFPHSQTHNPEPQGQYYCAVGGENAFGREIVEKAYIMAHFAGIEVSGMNAEVAPGQWEIQVGIVKGIKAGDDLWMLRYILNRITEEYQGYRVDFRAKPILNYYGQPDTRWNGSGLHTNFSNPLTRGEIQNKNGLDEIEKAIEKLSKRHKEHIEVYGADNNLRLTGKLETSSISTFSYSVGGRNTSVRIPNDVALKEYGYFEDRRPSSSADPYQVISALVYTTD